jgi:hypothetical protein
MKKKLALGIEFFTMGNATTGCHVFVDMFDYAFRAGETLLLTRKENQ